MILLLNMDISRAISVRLWVAISMILLLNMDISRAISRLSRPLAISMMISFWMINLNLIIRVWPVDILVAITTVAISSLSRSLVITSIAISLNSLGTSVIVAYSRGVTISRLSRSLVITSITISMNSLGTSVVITDT